MSKSRDLFDDSTMSFGEHLEVLRVHLWRAIIGLLICVILALIFSNHVVDVVRGPIDRALQKRGIQASDDIGEGFDLWSYLNFWNPDEAEATDENELEDSSKKQKPVDSTERPAEGSLLVVEVDSRELASALHRLDPENYPQPLDHYEHDTLKLSLKSERFAQLQSAVDAAVENMNKPIVLTVQEAFMTYLKVAFVTGFVMSSPWVFYQLWLFVAAGLYPHERKYVHIYMPLSLTLFLGGAAFCFFLVFPFVLDFLLGFAYWLGTVPQIRLSEWISFAILLPVMFGLSFQLPMVMLFLERISIFDVNDYREKRRMAVLVISIISMLMTPADPMSMMMMMAPLVVLYEMGILMCGYSPRGSSFEEASMS